MKAPIYRETKRVTGNISVLRQKVFSSCDKIYFLLGEERKYLFTENELTKIVNSPHSPHKAHFNATHSGLVVESVEIVASSSPLPGD